LACLFFSTSLATSLWAAAPGPVQRKPPNVLFIAIDDLRPELGAYGSATAQTPSLDRFARRSVSFSRHYAVVPTCGPSRYALLTGRSPLRSGVTSNNNALFQGPAALDPNGSSRAQTWPELFRRQGYHTVQIGKISHTPDGRIFSYNGSGDGRPELPGAWDELATPVGPWRRGWGAFFAYADGLHREDGRGHRPLMQFVAERDEDLPDGLMAAAAVEKLKQLGQSDQPFLLALGFFKPHLPFVAPREDWEAAAGIDPELPPSPDSIDTSYRHKSTEFYNYTFPFEKAHPLSKDAQRITRRAYLASARYVDRQVGKVLAALERERLAENTIVVVWSDHGWHLGDLQMWGKHSPFERALRSVLMIRAPGVSREGAICDALVESTDLYPTLVDLCDFPTDKTEHPLDGLSLRGLLTGQQSSLRSTALSYWHDAISVRTATHRLIARRIENKLSPEALYDLSHAADEGANLIKNEPSLAAALVIELRHRYPRLSDAAP
jgi:arylsulfatase A-like enzyme